ncbi:MAG: PH domain-containing protein [bacterium]|nr:PH domain-containing protein [bacterium]
MRARLLALLRVPERPDPPPGSGDALETFRAARGFLHYSVLMWFPKQIAAFAGLMASLAFFGGIDDVPIELVDAKGWDWLVSKLGGIELTVGPFDLTLTTAIGFFEILAVLTWAGQLIFTGLLLKPSWELRWYMVGERSLRIRHGLWSVREQTMTIANIQNMIVRQGPVQRLFGISDLEVHTAGGGSGSGMGEDPTEQKDSFHVGRFRGLEDASALRDTIRERLQAVQGLGAKSQVATEAKGVEETGDLAAAAHAVLAEARALRRVV